MRVPAGSGGVWSQQLAELALTEGMSTFILGTDDPEQIRRFAAEVAPAVRDLVAAARHDARVPGPVTDRSGHE